MSGAQDAFQPSRSPVWDPIGTVIICSNEGNIIKVIRDDLQLIQGRDFTELTGVVDRDSRMKLGNFLVEVDQQGYAFNWEITFRVDGSLKVLTTSGLVDSEQVWLVLGEHPDQTNRLVRESLKHLKKALPFEGRSEMESLRQGLDRLSFQEITRINSELVSLQREIQQQKLELEALNQEKDRFLSLAAHDLRNPLAAIMSYSEFLIDDLDDHLDKEHRQFLESIGTQSQYMLNLIEDLLDVSIISLGGMTLKKEWVNLAELISESVRLNHALARRKGIDLSYNGQEDDSPLVEVDPTKFKQVLNNLLSNGIKFCSGGSKIEVESSQEGAGFQVLVRDNGPGIPAVELDQLFNLFQRTSVISPDGEKSTGLGLAIARNIVEMHGGKVTVNSKPGEGTEFQIDMPGSGR